MKLVNKISLLVLVLSISHFAFGQDKSVPFEKSAFKDQKDQLKVAVENLEKGNEIYLFLKQNDLAQNWSQAIPFFEAAYKFNPKNAELNYKLGDCYLNSNTKSKALSYFLSSYELDSMLQRDILHKIGYSYHNQSKFDDAIKYYEQHLKKLDIKKEAVEIKQINKLISECKNSKEMVKNPIRVWVDNLGPNVNSPYPDYGALISADESVIIFTSRRPSPTSEEMFDGMYYEDIFISTKDENGNWQKATPISDKINTKEHDATAGLSNDGLTLFIYSNDGKNGGNISQSKKGIEGWENPKDLGKNVNTSNSWDTGASLSPDGKKLYFESNKEGTLGLRDIWVSDWDEKKQEWGPSKPLGAPINTEYDEIGVFMHPDGKTMYFSSNGHKGMGGFDIYYSEMQADGTWGQPVNIGYPVSTPDNDVFFSISASGKRGYYASFTESGQGEKDLHMITFLGKPKEPILSGEDNLCASIAKPIQEEIVQAKVDVNLKNLSILKGKVLDDVTKQPVNSTVDLSDNAVNQKISQATTDSENGKFLISLPSGKNYGIAVKADGYLFHSENFDIPADASYQEYEKIIYMKKVKVGESIVLRNIFFDLDKYSLKPESKTELDRLLQLLEDNPTLEIEISGHTDNQGSAEYNQRLSEDRAKAVVDFLVALGISRDRFEYKGYGESKPQVSDDEILKMKSKTQKDEANAQNRRTEFKILKI